MSPLKKKSDSRNQEKKIWSAWMRFGSPRVSVEHQSPNATDEAGSNLKHTNESDLDVHNDYFVAARHLS